MTEWQGKRVVIVGLARQGLALARYLAKKGCRLVLTDQRQDEEMRDIQQSLDDLVRNEKSTIEWSWEGIHWKS
jgi:UDP-N-acetylmuramoylalanine--D-glutamate ligase